MNEPCWVAWCVAVAEKNKRECIVHREHPSLQPREIRESDEVIYAKGYDAGYEACYEQESKKGEYE